MTAETILESTGLRKAFGRRVVLVEVSFAARRGRTTVLMGRNGAGKSTALRLSVGLVRWDEGQLVFKGRPLRRPNLASMAGDGLYYSAQESALTNLCTVGAHLETLGRVYARPEAVGDVVGRMRLSGLVGRRSSLLSGGERRRVHVAMALLRRPDCLIVDEPFAGLEPKDRELITETLCELRNDGCAILITGHDVHDVFALADEVIWITGGETRHLGSPAEAVGHEPFRPEYLGQA